jgi:hypothetical protein
MNNTIKKHIPQAPVVTQELVDYLEYRFKEDLISADTKQLFINLGRRQVVHAVRELLPKGKL